MNKEELQHEIECAIYDHFVSMRREIQKAHKRPLNKEEIRQCAGDAADHIIDFILDISFNENEETK